VNHSFFINNQEKTSKKITSSSNFFRLVFESSFENLKLKHSTMIRFSIISLFLLFITKTVFANNNPQTLNLKENISKTINLSETHEYLVDLKSGEFSHITVLQKGIDLIVESYDLNGEKIETFDSNNGANGPELVFVDAKESGKYKIIIKPLGEVKKVKSGNYDIVLNSINSDVNSHLENVLHTLSQRDKLPGYAMCLLNKDEILYQNAYGYANLEEKTPFTSETLTGIASISKTFIGVSLMQLVEAGKLDLETKINDILPFEIHHHFHPTIPIRVKHLANHTAGFSYSKYYQKKSYVVLEKGKIDKEKFHKEDYKEFKDAEANELIPMDTYFKNLWTKGGKWYTKKNFIKSAPGEKHQYSNSGAALAAHIVEIISGQSFDAYTHEHILKPLGMNASGWSINEVEASKHAMLYGILKNPLPKYTNVTYPDGSMITSLSDLSTYFQTLIQGFEGSDEFLKESSLKEMMKSHIKDGKSAYGIFWELYADGNMGHSGGDSGMTANMQYNPNTKIGLILMTNMSYNGMAAATQYVHVLRTLKRYKI